MFKEVAQESEVGVGGVWDLVFGLCLYSYGMFWLIFAVIGP